jgi:hypothetical protein
VTHDSNFLAAFDNSLDKHDWLGKMGKLDGKTTNITPCGAAPALRVRHPEKIYSKRREFCCCGEKH